MNTDQTRIGDDRSLLSVKIFVDLWPFSHSNDHLELDVGYWNSLGSERVEI
jgi:hypothetical protein